MLSKNLNKSSGSVNDHGCAKEDYTIESVQEYLNCSKTVFEIRLNEQMKKSSYDDFILHQSIGEGAFGRVMLVHHKSDENVFFAMKVIYLVNIKSNIYLVEYNFHTKVINLIFVF